jgi:polyhydroxyalkanoate synthesis regulator phasin
MKRYKNGVVTEVPAEEAEKLRSRFLKNRKPSKTQEERIKELEKTVAELQAKLSETKEVEE